MRTIDDSERRARLARRHGLLTGHPDVLSATTAMTVLHATEAASVHLALWARVPEVTVADIDRSLYDDRALVKQLAMRRTLFVFPRDLLPAAWGSAAARTALQQHRQLVRRVASGGIADDAEAWVATACAAVLDRLSGGESLSARELREQVPALHGRITLGGGPAKKWGGEFSVAPWVVGLLGAQGRIVRAVNAGSWHLSRPTWAAAEHWLGEVPPSLGADEGYAELVRRWLWTFGPGTEADIVWWLGATKTIVRRALADVGAVEVGLDSGAQGWVLADDVEPVPPVEPWAALLPTLDPTVMGWKERAFYLDPTHAPYLFDSNGNAGNTAWWDGRIVGCWVQEDDGTVRVILREDVGRAGRDALDARAARLTSWLEGRRITNVYASPQMKESRLP